ncbi:SUMO-specific isopeptidase USPL1 [Brachyhypopomus gauderio]|uniref:SUMO-specific isopeptidase USPL1 n=1 Tax=Brachyhypopomus gauderio TaxID=698409 RepID=UPI0040427949
MVMLTLWRRATPNNGVHTDHTVAMKGEGTVVGAQSPELAGYLSKDEGKGGPNGDCPWCSAKGQTNTLRSYAVNLKESITLCTSPQCLFPLVSSPLEDVYASLASARSVNGCRRKSPQADCEDSHPPPKRRKAEPDVLSEANVSLSSADESDSPLSVELSEEKLFTEGHSEQMLVVNGDKRVSTEVSTAATGYSDERVGDYVSSTQEDIGGAMLLDETKPDLVEMVTTRPHLFWKNRDNLCWLDSLLVALVHFRAFREALCENVRLPKNFPSKHRTVVDLSEGYKKICAYIKAKEQKCQGSAVLIPLNVLHKAEQELVALQLSVFRILKPKLRCELGQQETPVFALPLLLQTDDWAQSVFQHAAVWEFTCKSCGYAVNTSVEKTITTFTQLVSDWHPLQAVHRAQCNNCHRKNQRRKLVFQKVSSVLALHFVEGLPRKDVSRYSFQFQGTHYDITTIIQYNRELEHFVTWILQPDGLWLEFDDLKYPHSITHKRFTLPAKEFHIVFWEATSRTVDQLAPAVDSGNEGDHHHDSASSVPNDTCIVEALTVSEDDNKTVPKLNASIGNTTLLDTFEGLSHDDIVTLTLVEVEVDAEGKTLEGVAKPVKSRVTAVPEKTLVSQAPCATKPKKTTTVEASSTPAASEIVLPSVVRPTAPAAAEPLQVNQPPPSSLLSNPTVSSMSFLYQQHPSHRSTPVRVPLQTSPPKPDLSSEGGDVLPAKPAELFGGFKAKSSPSPVLPGVESRHPLTKPPHPTVALSQKPLAHSGGSAAPVGTPEAWADKIPRASAAKSLSATDALRLKLMKKLKAKKKKLAKLNLLLLGKGDGEVRPRPDSTDITSLYSVTSSTSARSSPAYDRFFADLLSPATTASNLSPDSTGLLEILASSQGSETSEDSPRETPKAATADLTDFVLPEPVLNNPSSTNQNDFLEEFISGAGGQQSTIDNTDFNALDMFF